MKQPDKKATAPTHWLSRLLLIKPQRVERQLECVAAAGVLENPPNSWQLSLGVLRMWHRVLFRSDSIGTCREQPVRSTWRARLLAFRPLRFPFLLAERAVAPWDFSGLLSSRERVMRHLLGAHHDGVQFVYDLEMLGCFPGALDELQIRAAAVVNDDSPRHRWLRDLTVYERYHEQLSRAVDLALKDEPQLSDEQRDDPDISFLAYLRWCALQPATPEQTRQAWRRGSFSLTSDPRTARLQVRAARLGARQQAGDAPARQTPSKETSHVDCQRRAATAAP